MVTIFYKDLFIMMIKWNADSNVIGLYGDYVAMNATSYIYYVVMCTTSDNGSVSMNSTIGIDWSWWG